MLNKFFPVLRPVSRQKVQCINAMAPQDALLLREAGFEALCCEILDAFWAYSHLRQVTITLDNPIVTVGAAEQAKPDEPGDLVLRITHQPRLETAGANVLEWQADIASFLGAHLPLSHLGIGRFIVERAEPTVHEFLDWANEEEPEYARYQQIVSMLVQRANNSFGAQYLQQELR